MNDISWQAPEYFYTEKTSDWYWIVGIISITIAITSIVFNNILFALLILIGSFTLCLYASRKPNIITIKINDKGIMIGDLFYFYELLNSFWIEEKELHPRLILKSKKKLSTHIVAILGNVSGEEIREKLQKNLVEEQMSEPFLEKLLIYFGF